MLPPCTIKPYGFLCSIGTNVRFRKQLLFSEQILYFWSMSTFKYKFRIRLNFPSMKLPATWSWILHAFFTFLKCFCAQASSIALSSSGTCLVPLHSLYLALYRLTTCSSFLSFWVICRLELGWCSLFTVCFLYTWSKVSMKWSAYFVLRNRVSSLDTQPNEEEVWLVVSADTGCLCLVFLCCQFGNGSDDRYWLLDCLCDPLALCPWVGYDFSNCWCLVPSFQSVWVTRLELVYAFGTTLDWAHSTSCCGTLQIETAPLWSATNWDWSKSETLEGPPNVFKRSEIQSEALSFTKSITVKV